MRLYQALRAIFIFFVAVSNFLAATLNLILFLYSIGFVIYATLHFSDDELHALLSNPPTLLMVIIVVAFFVNANAPLVEKPREKKP